MKDILQQHFAVFVPELFICESINNTVHTWINVGKEEEIQVNR